jgi:hypothetical protein
MNVSVLYDFQLPTNPVWSENSIKPHLEATTGAAALQALEIELLRPKSASNSHEEEFTILEIGSASDIWLRLKLFALHAAQAAAR